MVAPTKNKIKIKTEETARFFCQAFLFRKAKREGKPLPYERKMNNRTTNGRPYNKN